MDADLAALKEERRREKEERRRQQLADAAGQLEAIRLEKVRKFDAAAGVIGPREAGIHRPVLSERDRTFGAQRPLAS